MLSRALTEQDLGDFSEPALQALERQIVQEFVVTGNAEIEEVTQS